MHRAWGGVRVHEGEANPRHLYVPRCCQYIGPGGGEGLRGAGGWQPKERALHRAGGEEGLRGGATCKVPICAPLLPMCTWAEGAAHVWGLRGGGGGGHIGEGRGRG